MTDIGTVLNPQARGRRRTRRLLRGRHAVAPAAAVVPADVPVYPEPTPEPAPDVAGVAAPEPDRPALGKLFL